MQAQTKRVVEVTREVKFLPEFDYRKVRKEYYSAGRYLAEYTAYH